MYFRNGTCYIYILVGISTQTLNVKIMLIYIRNSVKFYFLPSPRKCALKSVWFEILVFSKHKASFTSVMSVRQTTLSSTEHKHVNEFNYQTSSCAPKVFLETGLFYS